MSSRAAMDFASKLETMMVSNTDTLGEQPGRIAALLDDHVRGLVALASDTAIQDDVARSIIEFWKPG